jgi:hypothetical protein
MDMKVDALSAENQASDSTNGNLNVASVQPAPRVQPIPPANTPPPNPPVGPTHN